MFSEPIQPVAGEARTLLHESARNCGVSLSAHTYVSTFSRDAKHLAANHVDLKEKRFETD
jgi:hypothetical protein